MKLDQEKIKEILLKENYIQKKEAEKAVEFAQSGEGSFVDYFLRKGRLTTDILGQALAEYFKVQYFDLNTKIPPKEVVLKIPEDFAVKFRAILCEENDKGIIVATDNPSDKTFLEEIKKIFPDKNVFVYFSLSEDIDSVLLSYKKPLEARFSKIIVAGEKVVPEIVDEIINDALDFKASDIHFEPQKKEAVIRFRVDGFLREAGRIPIEYYENILNRVKLQSGLSTVEHFSAQDGAIRYENKKQRVDLRVSVVPTVDGEKIVIRVLSENKEGLNLDDLGFSKEQQNIILRGAKKTSGMILVTGPTGSGKTTTLYAILKYLNTPEKNIATIEDPVEYKIPGVNHIQVNAATNLTFAEGLKSIVRQDPDIILVGEIRDKETASIAVNAALSGHLLFSTFHANDAASVIPRFLEMGVEPFYLSLTLKVVISQRLVRKICDKCRHSYEISKKELAETYPGAEKFFDKDEITLYKGKGCSACSNSGYRGRTAIFEVLEIDQKTQDLMLKSPSAQQIWEAEKQKGIKSLFFDGIEKVKNGTTTMEELLRETDLPE